MNAMNQEDELLKRLFAKSEVKPSTNMTEKVMHRIDVNPKAFQYEPIISKKSWIVMGGAFAVTMLYLLMNSTGVAYEFPTVLELVKNGIVSVGDSFSFEFTAPSLPEIPSTFLLAIAAINVIGIYILISFRWRKWMFR